MIYVACGKEQDYFIDFVENALGILANEDYASFISIFDSSRLSEHDLVLALRYLDISCPILKIDDPKLVKSKKQNICLFAFNDGSGYYMDYDLTTDGAINDLTIQIEFLRKAEGYIVVLDDLHTL